MNTIYGMEKSNCGCIALMSRSIEIWVRAMNEYVSQFAHHGIIGLLVFMFPFFFIVLKLFKKIRVTTGTEQLDTIAVTLSLIGSAVASLQWFAVITVHAYWVILLMAMLKFIRDGRD